MLFPHSEIEEVAPNVTSEALRREGVENPFISLRDLESLCQGEILELCLRDMVMQALRYAETVCLFKQIVARGQIANEDGSRLQIEQIRTASHDATIASVNLLARHLPSSSSWIKKLVGNRAAYTKFALLISFEAVKQGGHHE